MGGLRAGGDRTGAHPSVHDVGAALFPRRQAAAGHCQLPVCAGRAHPLHHRPRRGHLARHPAGHLLRRGHHRHAGMHLCGALRAALGISDQGGHAGRGGIAGPASGHRHRAERRDQLDQYRRYQRAAQRAGEAGAASDLELVHVAQAIFAVVRVRGVFAAGTDAAAGPGHGADLLCHHAVPLLRLHR